MVPKLHAKGCSFRGLVAQYLLKDKGRAETSERVAWTATRNLATDCPQLGWKLCAATAMDADRLKSAAGVKNTGRKSKNAVAHLSLAWHPERDGTVDRVEMERAADLAIKALGAEGHQAIIVAHSDCHPHIHIVINRVSQFDGRILPSSKEKLRLSKFALDYERERGEVLCENRALNWEARDRGQYVRGEKDIPRHIYEQHLANDNRPGKADRHRKQREKDRAIGKRQREVRDRQSAAWAKFERDHKARRTAILVRQKSESLRARDRIQAAYRAEKFAPLYRVQNAELRAFERDEQKALGKFKNRFKALDLKGLVGSMKRERSVGPLFDAVSSSGAGLKRLKRQHERQKASLRGQERRDVAEAVREIGVSARAEMAAAGNAFEGERAALVFKCTGESAKMRAEWKQRVADRSHVDGAGLRRDKIMKKVLDRKANERGSKSGRDTEDHER